MAEIIKLKKGLDIPLQGAAPEDNTVAIDSATYAVTPDDFPGMRWKLKVAPGDSVRIGDTLLADKTDDCISLVSPASGTVAEVRRGERRKIEEIVIQRSGDTASDINVDFSTDGATRETLAKSGLWAMLRQRPYDIIPRRDAVFRDIFVTAFDSAPLAPSLINPGDCADLEDGMKILSSLTAGKVWLSTRFGDGLTSKVAEVREFKGPHPAGNTGVQIANIRPVNKGETVLTLDSHTAVLIGRLARTGRLDFSCNVAVTGPEIENPYIAVTTAGVGIAALIKNHLKSSADNIRVISGNVLTGVKTDSERGHLRYPYRQVSVIAEGNHADEFMGWASMNPRKFSVKRTFPAFLRGLGKIYDFDARLKGGERAMILSGEYDKVFPFDIYSEFLLKAIIAKDIDKMEKLGIYEVAPEDFALPEFIDTSKIPLQKIVREGLDYLREETE